MNASTSIATASATESFRTSLRQVLLEPASIALVGASDDAGKTGGRPLQFLRRAGFAGTIYPINPHRSQVQGEPAWPSLAALPEVLEFHRMSGDVDYLLKVVTTDIDGYDRFYKRLIKVAQLTGVSSAFSMEQIKFTTALPLELGAPVSAQESPKGSGAGANRPSKPPAGSKRLLR